MEEKINQRIAWIEQRVELSELAKEYIAFQMMQFAKYYHEQQVKSVDLAEVGSSILSPLIGLKKVKGVGHLQYLDEDGVTLNLTIQLMEWYGDYVGGKVKEYYR